MTAAMIIQLLPTVAKQRNAFGLLLKPSGAMPVKLEKKKKKRNRKQTGECDFEMTWSSIQECRGQ